MAYGKATTVFNETWKTFIEGNASLAGVEIRREHTDRFAVHAEELIRWNRGINLTAITDPMEIAIKHFLDSSAPALFLGECGNLLDIGSGGGFPGLVIAVLFSRVKVTLIDASLKKVHFLKHVARTTGLMNVRAVQIRADEMARRSETFDVVISRALTGLRHFVEMADPLVSSGGRIIAMTGPSVGNEDVALLSKEWLNRFTGAAHAYTLPEIHHPRRLHIFQRISG